MQKIKTNSLRSFFVLLLWVVLVQFILINISSSIYAYKFTHFYTHPEKDPRPDNFFTKTWKLFVGPKVYKQVIDSEPNFSFTTVSLSLNDKTPIEGWYSQRDSAKGCIIFFHGVTSSKQHLIGEAMQFYTTGYNVLLVDFRTHGNSGGKKTSFGVKETEEVEKAFRFAREKGNKKIILYGASLGAVIIMKAVADGKVQPAGLIADMPFGSLQDHLKARARVIGFPSQPFAFFVTAWIGLENEYNGFNHSAYSYAKKINCPILLQWGERDEYVLREEIENIYNNIKSPTKQLVIYPNAGHQSGLSVDPLYWEENVFAFVQKL